MRAATSLSENTSYFPRRKLDSLWLYIARGPSAPERDTDWAAHSPCERVDLRLRTRCCGWVDVTQGFGSGDPRGINAVGRFRNQCDNRGCAHDEAKTLRIGFTGNM